MKSQLSLGELLERMSLEEASDLHIAESDGLFQRVQGVLSRVGDAEPANSAIADLAALLNKEKQQDWQSGRELDIAHTHRGIRFRLHLYLQSGKRAVAIRRLATSIPTPSELGIPQVVRDWARNQTGLVIVTGPTGSGKTTTLAALANEVHQTQTRHIVTIEDPIEYLYPPGQSNISQREVGRDVADFNVAVRAALREDVDVLVIGEMRDVATIEAALAVAETGHLVFATLHTHNSPQAIDRLVDAFASDEQPLTRSRLSACLLGVVYQRLVPTVDQKRVAAFEVLVATPAIKALIRDGKTHQIPNIMETARSEGMQPMLEGLKVLAQSGRIKEEMIDVYFRENV